MAVSLINRQQCRLDFRGSEASYLRLILAMGQPIPLCHKSGASVSREAVRLCTRAPLTGSELCQLSKLSVQPKLCRSFPSSRNDSLCCCINNFKDKFLKATIQKLL